MQLEIRVAPKGIQYDVFNRLAQYKADVASLTNQLVSEMSSLCVYSCCEMQAGF